jgi:hypothetical protein
VGRVLLKSPLTAADIVIHKDDERDSSGIAVESVSSDNVEGQLSSKFCLF